MGGVEDPEGTHEQADEGAELTWMNLKQVKRDILCQLYRLEGIFYQTSHHFLNISFHSLDRGDILFLIIEFLFRPRVKGAHVENLQNLEHAVLHERVRY